MSQGEITGQLFGMSKLEQGMPFRSQYTTKKHERGHFSTLDDDVNIQITKNDGEATTAFKYFDPAMVQTGQSEFQRVTDPKQPLYNEASERQLQNIAFGNSDYVNNIAFNMYNELCKVTSYEFCIFPMGILQNMIERDMTIAKIMTQINNSEMYHGTKQSINNVISRTSASITLDEQVKSKINYYDDVNNIVVEFPMNNDGFAFGVICDKNNNEISINNKLFSGFMLNLHKSPVNVYLPAFEVKNSLYMNGVLKNLGYISSDMVKYSQSLYFELPKTLLIRSASGKPIINLARNFIYYIRYIPNNVVLYIGRRS